MKYDSLPLPPDSFRAVERRIAVTCDRLPQLPRRPLTLTRLIIHVHKRTQELTNNVLRLHGLNNVTYSTLMMLYGSVDFTISPSDLSAATGEKPTNITRICDELVQRGWISRVQAEDDRRKVILTLTDSGQALIESLRDDISAMLERLYVGIENPQREHLEHLLKAVLGNVESA